MTDKPKSNSIFLTVEDKEKNSPDKSSNISGKITYTNFLDMIPENKLKKQVDNWRNKYSVEWRWRLLEFNDKKTIEISFVKNNSNDRWYKNKYGKLVVKSPQQMQIYEQFVKEVYYYYTK